MLKDILNIENKPVDATLVAHAALVRGMAVAKGTNGKTAFITDGATKGMFLVDAEDPAGAYEIRPEGAFDAIAKDAPVKLVKYLAGEAFATNQCPALAVGDYVKPSTDGKFAKSVTGSGETATASATSLICRGTTTVGGVTLYIIEVLGE